MPCLWSSLGAHPAGVWGGWDATSHATIHHPPPLPCSPACSDLLSGTRSSRLYRSLVLDGKALAAAAYSSYPADKHATQFSVYAVPTKGR